MPHAPCYRQGCLYGNHISCLYFMSKTPDLPLEGHYCALLSFSSAGVVSFNKNNPTTSSLPSPQVEVQADQDGGAHALHVDLGCGTATLMTSGDHTTISTDEPLVRGILTGAVLDNLLVL